MKIAITKRLSARRLQQKPALTKKLVQFSKRIIATFFSGRVKSARMIMNRDTSAFFKPFRLLELFATKWKSAMQNQIQPANLA
jgi:hypothetical protein